MKFSHVLERSPRDWETTMHQNVVLAFFHTQNICHGAWKILRTTLCCFIFLQSRGEGLKSKENYGTKYLINGTKGKYVTEPDPELSEIMSQL